MLGLPVTQITGGSFKFTNVAYRWETSDNGPVIKVTGEVINQTNQTRSVPTILVNLRDAQTGKTIEGSKNIRDEPLAAQEAVPFSLELTSPPEKVNQVELRFAAR
jgi:hypothetical protein